MQDPLRQFKAEFFKALAHPARIKILELLRDGELSVNELQARLEIEPSGVSQQLAILRSRQIVESRKNGTSVYYRVRDPQVFELLDVARRIFGNSLTNTQSMLAQLNEEQAQLSRRKTRRTRASS
ncbi:MAG: winged helix-turn-helix transcriptional regulator [Chloroflexi bacterium]|nr:winged helix-turn-helix transcriptional regulator [Chloroflexota bacterium]